MSNESNPSAPFTDPLEFDPSADAVEREELSAMDQQVSALFAQARPLPNLEERMVLALRTVRKQRQNRIYRAIRIALASAAVLLVGAVGAVLSAAIDDGGMVTPMAWLDGEPRSESTYQYMQLIHGTTYHGMNVTGLSDPDEMADHFSRKLLAGDWYSLGDRGGDVRHQPSEGKMRRYTVSNFEAKSSGESLDALAKQINGRNGEVTWEEAGRAESKATYPFQPNLALIVDDSKSMPKSSLFERKSGLDEKKAGAIASGGTNVTFGFGRQTHGAPLATMAPPTSTVMPTSPRTPPPTNAPALGIQPQANAFAGLPVSPPVGGAAPAPTMSESGSRGPAGEAESKKQSDVDKLSATKLGRELREENKTIADLDHAESSTETLHHLWGTHRPATREDLEVGRKNELDKKLAERLEQLALLQKQPEPKGNEPPKVEAKKVEPPKFDPTQTAASSRKIIRSGDIDFEVDSFDAAVANILRLIHETKGGFVATINSEKLANGKVKGTVAIRIPPEQLDLLILDLRRDLGKMGELKGQRIGSQDVTKQFSDTDSRLRAARAMEERLLKMIAEGKGQIKDLLQAEKELGVWRTQIETMEGELRYLGNMVALSSLNINLTEKEIRTAASVSEMEKVQAGVEVEDVEQSHQAVLKEVQAQKGRVTRAELRQQGPKQMTSVLYFQVSYDNAGPIRDFLKTLGTTERFEVDRMQQTEGGGPAPKDGKLKRGDTEFQVSLYNVTNFQPREVITMKWAATDVAKTYHALREAALKAKGRISTANLNEQDRQNVVAQFDVVVPFMQLDAVLNVQQGEVEIISRNSSRSAEAPNTTLEKVLVKIELTNATNINPRVSEVYGVEVADVERTAKELSNDIVEMGGRKETANFGQDRAGRTTANLVFRLPLKAVSGIKDKLAKLGTIRVSQTRQDPQAPEGKLAQARLDITLANGDLLVPSDGGFLASLRYGLSFSLRALAFSASWLVVGVMFILPWVLVVYCVVWLFRRLFRRNNETPPTATMVSPASTPVS